MTRAERDQALLSLLKPGERANLEAQVNEFIANELTNVTAETLRVAAELFEEQTQGLPAGEASAGLLLAALLRVRATILDKYEDTNRVGDGPSLGADSRAG